MKRTSFGTSNVMESNRISALMLWVLVVFVMGSVVGTQHAAAGMVAGSSMTSVTWISMTALPVSWQPVDWTIILDAASGDLVVTSLLPPRGGPPGRQRNSRL